MNQLAICIDGQVRLVRLQVDYSIYLFFNKRTKDKFLFKRNPSEFPNIIKSHVHVSKCTCVHEPMFSCLHVLLHVPCLRLCLCSNLKKIPTREIPEIHFCGHPTANAKHGQQKTPTYICLLQTEDKSLFSLVGKQYTVP
jgi:hypothetical protein